MERKIIYVLIGIMLVTSIVAYMPLASSADYRDCHIEKRSNGDTFSELFDLTYSPQRPKSNQSVRVTLTAKEEMGINWINLVATFRKPDSFPQETAGTFTEKGGNWTTTIPAYPAGTMVEFHIEVFDTNANIISSRTYSYEVEERIQVIEPLITVYDDLNHEYVDNATVKIENNDGLLFEGQTIEGKVKVNVSLTPGSYQLIVEYLGEEVTKDIVVSGEEDSETSTYRVNIKPEATLHHETIDFPQLHLVGGVLLAILLPLLLLWGVYREKQEKRLALTKEKNLKKIKSGDSTLKDKLSELLINETIDPEYLVPAGMFLLSIFGLSFIPFYPWWMVVVLSIVVGAVAYKYPYNALIILALLITGSAAYQSPEFGLVFLIFSLLIMVASFFDWRFGFLVFAVIFLARFGAIYLVPVMSVILFSTYLALISTAAGGIFLAIASSSSNVEVFGLVPAAEHQTSFMLFSKDVVHNFSPGSLGGALADISSANGKVIMMVLSENLGASVLPFIQILLWCIGVYLIASIFEGREPRLEKLKGWLKYPLEKQWRYSTVGALLLGLSPLIGLIYFGYIGGLGPIHLAITGVIIGGSVLLAYIAQGVGIMTKSMFREYYRNKLGITDVGTRVAEMTDLGETTFDDIGGLEDVKEEVKESILIPLLRPDISERFGVESSKGVLLFGPIGCGKTMLMKALATELEVEMVNVKCGDVMSRWYGESEEKMTKLFEIARQRKPCILFFDEIDTIAKKREMYATDDVTPRLLSLLLSELDGMDRAEGIIIVASTNKPGMLDPALLRPGRFDKIIYVPTPGRRERKEILSIHLRNKPLSKNVDLDLIAKKTEGFSGADLANLAKEAATYAMKRSIETKRMKSIDIKTFNKVLKHMTPSITPTMKEEYERTRKKYERKIHEFKGPEIDLGIGLSDIPDLKTQKEILKNQIIYSLTESEIVEKFNISAFKNVLLYGPKGCGKITLVKAALNDYGIPMRVIPGRELKEEIDEEGREVVKDLFNEVRDMAPAVIAVTEIEEIASGADGKIKNPKAFSSLLSLIEDVNRTQDIAFVSTSHYPDRLVDDLFERGRFEKTVHVPKPDVKRRAELIKMELESVPTSTDIDYVELAEKTEDFTSDDIKSAVEEAKINAVTVAKKGEPKVTHEIMKRAIEDTGSSLKEEMLRSTDEFLEREK